MTLYEWSDVPVKLRVTLEFFLSHEQVWHSIKWLKSDKEDEKFIQWFKKVSVVSEYGLWGLALPDNYATELLLFAFPSLSKFLSECFQGFHWGGLHFLGSTSFSHVEALWSAPSPHPGCDR